MEGRKGYVHSNGGSHVLFKGFSLHHSSATLSALYFIFFIPQHRLLIDWPARVRWRREIQPKLLRLWVRREKSGLGGAGMGESTSSIRTDSYLWEMTVCKYLNLWRATWGDNEERHKIGGVSSQHLFHQAFSNEVQLPDSMRLSGRMCRNTRGHAVHKYVFRRCITKRQKKGRLESWKARWGKKQKNT